MDEEILQDFLVEASELVDQLDEQLNDLEDLPTDSDLLNAIFRGFHTIKGGAGFLGITPLIEVCHRAENVFDKIRNGQVSYDAEVSEVIMQAFDVVGDHIESLKSGVREFPDSDPDLLQRLDAIQKGLSPQQTEEATPQQTEVESVPDLEPEEGVDTEALHLPPGVDPDGDMTDEEFEALLNQRDAASSSPQAKQPVASGLHLDEGADPDGDMTDAEFEALLQQREALEANPENTALTDNSSSQSLQLDPELDPDGDMTDAEFEALLNQRDQLTQPESVAEEVKEAVSKSAKPSNPTKSTADVESNNNEPVGAKKTTPEPVKTPAKPQVKASAESTVRVDTKRLDDIMNLVGELVLVRNRLLTLRNADQNIEEISTAVGNLDHVTTDLQSSVMKTRMQPVKKVFGRFPRVVRDLARKLNKKIELELQGEDTDLDKNLVEALADPLVHLVRNSVDHGIEMPADRVAAGKPEKGTVILAAQQEGDHILLSISDDGKGMDPDILRQKAVEKGMMDQVASEQLDDNAAFELILSAGFSTADSVSDISGRGVGMDVVKNMITKLNGSIHIDSALGKGTEIKIKVPLTLAILPTLMVAFKDDSYAIPLTSVLEIFDFNHNNINKIDGIKMVRLRDKSVPLLFLSEWLEEADKEDYSHDKVIIVSVGNERIGLVVDQVNGQEEVVIKPLGVGLKHLDGYAGATITGNGSIALILDLPGVVNRF